MGWKNWQYSSKGAIIFPLIYLIIFVVIQYFDDIGIATSIISPGTWFFVGIGGITAYVKYSIQIIISIITWIIVGALIGFIYGKIKSRNQNQGVKQ